MFTSLESYDLGLQSLHNFTKTLPGYLYYPRRDALLDCMHRPLAAMLPFSSSFTGKGKDGSILFEGDHGNLMTFRFSTVHAAAHAVPRQTGSGKSVNFVSILSQCFYEFAKVVIIEEGGSYFNLTRIYGDEAQYIVIDPSADLTLNYFDTGGLPLSPAQIEFVTTFLTAMCGESSDLEKIQDRAAIITPYVVAVYNDAYNEWCSGHRNELELAARMSLSIGAIIPKLPPDQNTAQDAYFELRDILAQEDSELEGFEREVKDKYESWTVQEINDCIIDDPEMLRNISYAFMKKATCRITPNWSRRSGNTLSNLKRVKPTGLRRGWRCMASNRAKGVCSTAKRPLIFRSGGFTSNSARWRNRATHSKIWSGLRSTIW